MARARRAADRRLGAGVDRRRARRRGDGAARVAQPPADDDAARRDRRATASTPRSAARAATRSARGPRSGSSPSATTSAAGTPRPSGPSCGTSTTGASARGEHVRVFPLSNWTELDVWQYIDAEELEVPSIYFAHEREVFRRDGMLYAVSPYVELMDGEQPFSASVRYRTVGDMSCTGAVASTARDAGRRGRRDRRDADHRARRDARRRPRQRGGDGGPQGCRLLLVTATVVSDDVGRTASSRPAAPRHGGLGRRRQVDAHRPPALRRQVDPRGPARPGRRGVSAAAATASSTSSLLTDGLRAEREQGITIDVAYRYFATPKRSFILADTPGHVQYTRNMVTGASTADLAIVLSTRATASSSRRKRHAFIASLLGIPHLVVAVNKMDLVDYDRGGLRRRRARLLRVSQRLHGVRDVAFIPISRAATATTSSSARSGCRGTAGLALLDHLEHGRGRRRPQPRRPALPGPVGDPPGRRRATTTTAATRARSPAACCAPATRSSCCRAARTTRSPRSTTLDGPLDEAFPPMSVTLRLADDLDVSRGDLICRPARPARRSAASSTADVCWMADAPLRAGGRYAIKHATLARRRRSSTAGRRSSTSTRWTASTGRPSSASTTSAACGCARQRPLAFDPYNRNRAPGRSS